MATLAAILAFVSIGSAVVLSMMIVDQVSKRGVKINFFLLRLFLPKYIDQYGKLTRKETGRTGPLYLPCIYSYAAGFVFAVIYLVAR
jgi:hypothetical protein